MNRHPQFALTLLCVLVLIGWNRLSIAQECSEIEYGGTVTLGGLESDVAQVVATAADGSIFVAGSFYGTVDFDPGEAVDERISNGAGDVFVSKYSSIGEYQWTRTFGGTEPDAPYGLATANDGGIVVSGYFFLTVDFDPADSEDLHTSNGSLDVFVTSFGNDGTYEWTRTFGGANPEGSARIALDDQNGLYVVGCFSDIVDFDPTEKGEDLHTSKGVDDIYLTKWTSEGDYLWTAIFVGSGNDGAQEDVDVDYAGNVFVTGCFDGTVDLNPDDDQLDEHFSNGDDDFFVVKLSTSGSFIFGRTVGGLDNDFSNGIAVDSDGSVLITGGFGDESPVDFDPTEGVDNRLAKGANDIFVLKLLGDGSYAWTWTAGGFSGEQGTEIVATTLNDALVVGWFGEWDAPPLYGVDFNPSGAHDIRRTAGGADVFLTRLKSDGSYVGTHTVGGIGNDFGLGISVDVSGYIAACGWFQDSTDFDPTEGEDVRASNGSLDAFLLTLQCLEQMPTCDGDANADGVVDPLDSGFVLSRLGCVVGNGDSECDASDLNDDSAVDPLDVGYVLSRFGECA